MAGRRPPGRGLGLRFAADLTAQEVLNSPHLLVGTPDQIAEDLNSYRERFAISYWVVQDTQPFAEVIALLAGS